MPRNDPIRKAIITIPEIKSLDDVRQVLSQALSQLQDHIAAQLPILNYQGKRISNVGVPVGADDVVTLKYLEGVAPKATKQPPVQRGGEGGLGSVFDKATFGMVRSLTAGVLPNPYYICKTPGTFLEVSAKIKTTVPTASDAILDIELSDDDGGTWNSIFPFGDSNKIVLPAGDPSIVTVSSFEITEIARGDLLRIYCLSEGDPAAAGVEVVLKWEVTTPIP